MTEQVVYCCEVCGRTSPDPAVISRCEGAHVRIEALELAELVFSKPGEVVPQRCNLTWHREGRRFTLSYKLDFVREEGE